MAKKQIMLIALVIIAVAIIGAAAYFLWSNNRVKNQTNANQPVGTVVDEVLPEAVVSLEAESNAEALPAEQQEQLQIEQSLKSLARNFFERYGSYPKGEGWSNLAAIRPQMTEKMQAQADKYQADKDALMAEQQKYGVTTQVLVNELLSQDDEAGAAVLQLTGQEVVETYPQELNKLQVKVKLYLVKSGNRWLVDGLIWQ